MNWSGGYKNRFRTSSEVRKTAFQQQSRIVLVDLVKDEVDNDNQRTIHIPRNEKKEFSPNSSVTDTSNNVPMQQFGTPFKNIPCGTSSDSEEYEKDGISSTNYSPYSSEKETSNEHEVTNSICQPSQMIKHQMSKYENLADNLAVETQDNSYSSCGSSRKSFVGSSPPLDLTDGFHHSTECLRFLTPVMYHANTIARSTVDRQHKLEGSNLPFSTTIRKDKAVVSNISCFETSVETNDSQVPIQASSAPIPEVITVHEKQSHFCSSPQKCITENRVAITPQSTSVPLTSMIHENSEEPVLNRAIELHKQHELTCGSRSNQSVEYATPTPCVINQTFHYPTPNLSCITPILHSENVVFSTKAGCQLPSDDYTTLFAPIDATPAHRKQVRFASMPPLQSSKILLPDKSTPNEGVSQTEIGNGSISSQSLNYNGSKSTGDLVEHHKLASHSAREEDQSTATTQAQPYQEGISTIHDTNSGRTPGKALAIPSTSFGPSVDQGKRPTSATRKREQSFTLPSNTKRSYGMKFKSRKSPHGRVHYCCCRTVVRKLKIRDAGTQTSP